MHPLVLAAVAAGRGLVTRQAALAAGLTEHELERLLRTGTWVVVRHGVYASAEHWATLDEYVGRPIARARAAHVTMKTEHVMSHDSAARELGLAVLRPRRELVHITRPDVRGSRTEHGVKHHGAVFGDEQVVDVDGIPVLDRARTAVDMAREHGITGGLPTFDSAMRAGVPRSAFRVALKPMRSWPYVTRARACVDLADPGAENPGETLARLLVLELDLGRVETQFPVPRPSGIAWCDLRVGRHLFEFDGRVKYTDDELWAEKKRQHEVCAHGLGMSRITWPELWPPQRARTLRRLAEEVAVTDARFGMELPQHLVDFARQVRGGRVA